MSAMTAFALALAAGGVGRVLSAPASTRRSPEESAKRLAAAEAKRARKAAKRLAKQEPSA